MHRPTTRIALTGVLGLGGIALAGLTAQAALAAPASGSSSPPSSAAAAPSGADADGLVTGHSSSSLTVQDLFGRSRTYTIGAGTTVHRGAEAATLADAEHVHVRATTADGQLRAQDVDVHPAGIDGRILSTSGGTLVVVDRDGLHQRITTSSGTRFTTDGQPAEGSAAREGSVVHATGVASSDGTSLDASTVDVRSSDAPPPRPAGPGPRPEPPAGSARPDAAPGGTGAAPGGTGAAPAPQPEGPAQPPAPAPAPGGDGGQEGGEQDGS